MLRSLVSIRIQVSFTPLPGCFSPFPLGTLLYRSSDIFSLGPWSALLQTEFHVLRPTQVPYPDRVMPFAYGALTLFGWLSQYHSTKHNLGNCPSDQQLTPVCTYYPDIRNACRLARIRFRLFPFRSPLLRESLRFLLSPATEMFHFAGFASTSWMSDLRQTGSPIRTSPAHWMLAPPRGVSPLAASFFAVRCHGILRMPLLLYSLIHLPHHILLSSYTGKLQAKQQDSELPHLT